MVTDGSNKPTSAQMDLLLKECSITKAAEQKYLKENQGLRYFADWLAMEDSADFRNIVRTYSKLPINAFTINVVAVKQLVVLRTWINDQVIMGGTLDGIDVTRFKAQVVRDYIRITFTKSDNSKISKLDPLTDTGDCVVWREELFTAYLQTVTGEGCNIGTSYKSLQTDHHQCEG